MRFILRFFVFWTMLALAYGACAESGMPTNPQLDASFRLMYELRFDAARIRLGACREVDPEDSLCAAAEAASYLFEEFNQKGVLTSVFFLNDERLLGGIEGSPDNERTAAFLAANQRAGKSRAYNPIRLPENLRRITSLLFPTMT